MDYKTVEMLGYAYYANKGYRILVSLVSNDAYDFVAEKDGEFIKVNVKRAGLKDRNNPNSWCIALSGAATCSRIGWVDVYLVYLPEHHKFVELPGDFFGGVTSKSRIIPKNLY